MDWSRASGILLHPTSLPGRFGIGDLGSEAYRWVDFLAQSGQKLWQVLPLGPTGYADSPYACLSAFAGNPLLISPERMVALGDLDPDDLEGLSETASGERIDYGAVIEAKMPLLQEAARRFLERASPERRADFARFCEENEAWLDDYALFAAAKQYHDNVIWSEWEAGIALRQEAALRAWKDKLAGEIAIQRVLQYFFRAQWLALRAYANGQGIRIIGDVPIFCAHDSADVWANPALFTLDEDGHPTHISGVPPDYFSETGQRWGNPLYRWDKMAARGYAWWVARMQATLDTVDIVRIDHFRGFIAYWEIPADEPTAVHGRWVPGPEAAVFEALEDRLGKLPILAEDLGVITPQVIGLRERFGFPGMKILQFAFDEEALHASFGDYERNPFLPHNYTQSFCVYTGTHDNDTALGWFENCSPAERQRAMSYLGCDEHEFHWSLIRAAMASVADIAIVPMQDVLALGSEARMNLPGTTGDNWTWRCPDGALSAELAARLAEMVALYER